MRSASASILWTSSVFAAERAHGAHAGDVLFDGVREVREVLLHARGGRAQPAEEVGAHQGDQRVGGHRQEGERHVYREQHRERADGDQQEGAVDRDHDDELLHLVQVRAGPRHQLSGGRAVVVVERKLVDLVVEVGAQIGLHAEAVAHREVAADAAGKALHGGGSCYGQRQYQQQRLVAVVDRLVDRLTGEERDGDARNAPDQPSRQPRAQGHPLGPQLLKNQPGAGA